MRFEALSFCTRIRGPGCTCCLLIGRGAQTGAGVSSGGRRVSRWRGQACCHTGSRVQVGLPTTGQKLKASLPATTADCQIKTLRCRPQALIAVQPLPILSPAVDKEGRIIMKPVARAHFDAMASASGWSPGAAPPWCRNAFNSPMSLGKQLSRALPRHHMACCDACCRSSQGAGIARSFYVSACILKVCRRADGRAGFWGCLPLDSPSICILGASRRPRQVPMIWHR